MEVRLGVAVLLGQTKVNNVHLVTLPPKSHEEIVWFDVAVNEIL
jgi:hypothetical protein